MSTTTIPVKYYELTYIEHHKHDLEAWKQTDGVTLLAIEPDGWGEFLHRRTFKADTLAEAKQKADKIMAEEYSTSGVFSVFANKKLMFTEEQLA